MCVRTVGAGIGVRVPLTDNVASGAQAILLILLLAFAAACSQRLVLDTRQRSMLSNIRYDAEGPTPPGDL